MIKQLRRSVPVLVLAASVAACSPPRSETATTVTPPPMAPPAISQADIDQSIQSMVAALIAGDAAKAGEGYKPDAIFLNARGKYETSAAIEAFWAEALKGGAGKGLTLETIKSGTSGDLAYTVSRFSGGITATTGHTVAITERQPDGSFKVVVQVSIPDPPAAK